MRSSVPVGDTVGEVGVGVDTARVHLAPHRQVLYGQREHDALSLPPGAAGVGGIVAHVLLALGDLLEENVFSEVDDVHPSVLLTASNDSAVTSI